MTEIFLLIPPTIYSIGCIVGFFFPAAVKPLQASLGSKIVVWQFILLVGSVAIGSLIRRRQWARIYRENESGVGVDLLARIEKVEEDLRSSTTILRVLSRQLEKLGIRFRVTRKALKEPMTEVIFSLHASVIIIFCHFVVLISDYVVCHCNVIFYV